LRNTALKSDLTSSEQSTLYSILNTAGAAFGLGAMRPERGNRDITPFRSKG